LKIWAALAAANTTGGVINDIRIVTALQFRLAIESDGEQPRDDIKPMRENALTLIAEHGMTDVIRAAAKESGTK
jgi:hypothetical protein